MAVEPNTSTGAPSVYINDAQCAQRYGVSRQTWWRWVRTGGAPDPVKLSPGCTRWKLAHVTAWEAEREGAE